MKLFESIKLRYRAAKYKNRHDRGGIAYLKSEIKKGQVVLDIGAHKAGYLYFIQKQVGDTGKVFAFEPQLSLYQYLKKIKKLFKWGNVTIEHIALSDSPGETELFIPLNKTGKSTSPGATIVKHKERTDFQAKETIITQTLDAYCRQHEIKPDFLKIDVEGNELKIFHGGLQTLQTCMPKILVEIEARHIGKEKVLETFKYMESLGYSGYLIYGIRRIPLSEFSFDKYQNSNDAKNYSNNFIFEYRAGK